MTGWALARVILIWAALAVAIGVPIAFAAGSEQLAWRGPVYILAGFAGIVAMSYSAYLGGHMVYAHGVGVEEAGGVERRRDSSFAPGHMLEALSAFFANAWLGLRNAIGDIGEGRLVPTLTGSAPSRRAVREAPELLADANRI